LLAAMKLEKLERTTELLRSCVKTHIGPKPETPVRWLPTSLVDPVNMPYLMVAMKREWRCEEGRGVARQVMISMRPISCHESTAVKKQTTNQSQGHCEAKKCEAEV
jgi:hypothetical protein